MSTNGTFHRNMFKSIHTNLKQWWNKKSRHDYFGRWNNGSSRISGYPPWTWIKATMVIDKIVEDSFYRIVHLPLFWVFCFLEC